MTCELVGLATRAAFETSIELAASALRMERFTPSMVLEDRLADIIHYS